MSQHTDQQLHQGQQQQQQQQRQSDVVDLTEQVTNEPGTTPSGAHCCQEALRNVPTKPDLLSKQNSMALDCLGSLDACTGLTHQHQ